MEGYQRKGRSDGSVWRTLCVAGEMREECTFSEEIMNMQNLRVNLEAWDSASRGNDWDKQQQERTGFSKDES